MDDYRELPKYYSSQSLDFGYKFLLTVIILLSIFSALSFLHYCFCSIVRKFRPVQVPRPVSPPKFMTFTEAEVEEEHVFGPEIDLGDKEFLIYMTEDEVRQQLMDEMMTLP